MLDLLHYNLQMHLIIMSRIHVQTTGKKTDRQAGRHTDKQKGREKERSIPSNIEASVSHAPISMTQNYWCNIPDFKHMRFYERRMMVSMSVPVFAEENMFLIRMLIDAWHISDASDMGPCITYASERIAIQNKYIWMICTYTYRIWVLKYGGCLYLTSLISQFVYDLNRALCKLRHLSLQTLNTCTW